MSQAARGVGDPRHAAISTNDNLRRSTSVNRPKEFASKVKNRKTSKRERRVFVNLPLPSTHLDRRNDPKVKYVSNRIVTSKYTTLTFVPKNLFEQFRRAANMYFLFMAILGLLPFFSVNNPVLTVLPLSTVVFITACKDAVEDYNRHKIDKQFNSSTCYYLQNFVNVNYPMEKRVSLFDRIISSIVDFFTELVKIKPKDQKSSRDVQDQSKVEERQESIDEEPSNKVNGDPEWKKTYWRNVRVGDFIFLRNGDAVPADAIILSTSESEGGCFVETKDLDGETNLKPRKAIPDTNNIGSAKDCVETKFYIDAEAPNSNLYSFSAAVALVDPADPDIQQPPAVATRNRDSIQSVQSVSTNRRSSRNSNFSMQAQKSVPVNINNLLLRAHVIRNTEWVIAMVVYTGVETKIMLNSGETPSKRSRIEKEMNKEVIFNFFVLIALALICAIGSAISSANLSSKTNGIATKLLDSNRDSIAFAAFLTFWASLIIFQNIIPISLYISIEFVKTFQAYFIYNDLDMWDEDTQTSCVPKSWNLSDDLGQIEYVFSDKTGTLTRNVMQFRECSINGKVYGRNGWAGKTDAEKGKEAMQGQETDVTKQDPEDIWRSYLTEMRKTFEPKYASTDPSFLTFVDPELFRGLQHVKNKDDGLEDGGSSSEKVTETDSSRGNAENIKEFFTLLAVCHTVVLEKSLETGKDESDDNKAESEALISSDTNSSTIDITQNGSSTDDIPNKLSLRFAKVSIKKHLNTKRLGSIVPSLGGLNSLVGPSPSVNKGPPIDGTVAVQLVYQAESPDEAALVSAAKNVGFAFLRRNNNYLRVDILGTEYDFEVLNVLEFNSTRKRMSIIVRRPKELGGDVALFCKGADNVIMERLAAGQDDLIAATTKDIDDFSNAGLRTLTLAYRTLEPAYYAEWAAKYREASTSIEDRNAKIDATADEIERELILLGATAIEDKLQEGVPECIATLREAGMKVWVLTGDKLETAINIGFAAQLLTKDMKLWTLRTANKKDVISRFNEIVDKFIDIDGSIREADKGESSSARQHAFVVDGGALAHLLEDKLSRTKLLQVAEVFASVICCRVSPLQKALVVELVRKGKRTVTLAIGDGANDVSMIQAANVGVGISGQEGVQAAMAADYAIAQFRYLQKLLIVHGHWDYMRISEMILNFFYKNVIWVFPVLWYQIYCLFSGNIFYDYSLVQLYNMIFTVGPVIVLGTTDQSVTASYCLRYPGIYSIGIKQLRYNRFRFALYFLDGIWQSLVVYYTFHFIHYNTQGVVSSSAYSTGTDEFSTAVAVTVIIIANLFVGFNTYHWNVFIWVTVFGEIVILLAFVLAYGAFPSLTLYGIGTQIFSQGTFWFGMLFGILAAGLPRYLITFIKQWFYPDDLDIVKQIKAKEKQQRWTKAKTTKPEITIEDTTH
ncbi:8932_t:CDS:2 [Paraglomus occultum]|uniref:Phospholipid-transporting ATPase n=1 Tax=Paraglomus occultum TaxID=144539 RepID=A0A9N8YZ75_9GLOM|nr:8932_t:CDS:2 [Paraglomus occultum]